MQEPHFHRRHLPHIYLPERTYFVTFRLKGSLPVSKIKELKNRKEFTVIPKTKEEKYKQDSKFLLEYDKLLHANNRINYLKQPKIAAIVEYQLKKLDGKDYKLITYIVMPNHVHLVFNKLENARSVDKIMQEIKRMSAYYANKELNKSGYFWQGESYDHIVRSEDELYKIIKYVLKNPVKARFVKFWHEWKYTYLAPEFSWSDCLQSDKT